MIKLVVFDVGGTLVDFHSPLNKVTVKILRKVFNIRTNEKEIQKIIYEIELKYGSCHFPRKRYSRLVADAIFQKFDIPNKKTKEFFKHWDKSRFGNQKLHPDALPTIKKLKGKYLLATLANSHDKVFHQRILKKTKLKGHFHLHIDSAAVGIKKPNSRIFKIVLHHFKVKPDDSVMIGDIPSADIFGAKRVGMHTILINRKRLPYHFTRQTKPDFEIHSLNQLLPIIKKL
jgi:putative hydrolase of the HAD superfamily